MVHRVAPQALHSPYEDTPMRLIHLCHLPLIAALAACSSTEAPRSEQAGAPSNDGRCNAATVQNLLGEHASSALVESARSKAGAEQVRVLAPGDAVTMDYNSQRLNIDIDEAEVVERITCG
jgi:hypothetical protein